MIVYLRLNRTAFTKYCHKPFSKWIETEGRDPDPTESWLRILSFYVVIDIHHCDFKAIRHRIISSNLLVTFQHGHILLQIPLRFFYTNLPRSDEFWKWSKWEKNPKRWNNPHTPCEWLQIMEEWRNMHQNHKYRKSPIEKVVV